MLIINPEDLSPKKSPNQLYRAFKQVLGSQVTVTSDAISTRELFFLMRKQEKAFPRGDFDGLSERIIVQIEEVDFKEITAPQKLDDELGSIGKKDTALDVLCSLLQSWGGCSEEVVNYMRETKLTSPEKIQETLAKALNPETLKELIFEQNLKKSAEERKVEDSIQVQSVPKMPVFGLFRT